MLTASRKSNWPLLVVYTIILVIGFMVSVFLVALYWSVGDISRVEPRAADYRADVNSNTHMAIFPISKQVVVSARMDHDRVLPDPQNDLLPVAESPTITSTLAESGDGTSIPTLTVTPEPVTPSPTSTQSGTPSPSPSRTSTLKVTIKPTSSSTPDKPQLTNPPQPSHTALPPEPTSTQQPTSTQSISTPRPTQPPPPPPTSTEDSYPPPRPTDPPYP